MDTCNASELITQPSTADEQNTTEKKTPRILIVDDHPFFSRGLAQVLYREKIAGEVATTASVAGAVADLQQYPDTEMVLLDLSLPDQEGLSLLHELETMGLPIPVVVISSREDDEAVQAAGRVGASGFLYKSADTPVLLRTLQKVRAGHTSFPGNVKRQAGPTLHLTSRQQEVLRLLAGGLPNKAICQTLALSEHTVKSHLKSIFGNLGVRNRTECVRIAHQLGLIS